MVGRRTRAALLAASLALSGCMTVATRDGSPTATDQMLPAHALREATRGLNLRLPSGSKIYVETPGLINPADTELVRQALEGHRLLLVGKPEADYLVTVAVPVLGTDDVSRVLGYPGGTLPALHGAATITLPELSVWSRQERTGVAELHAAAVDAHTHKLVAAEGPVFGVARIKASKLLTGFVFGDELAPPRVVATRR